jgi:hypothetical protein
MTTQFPFWLGSPQDSQVPSHRLSQQTPSTQWLNAHSPSLPQASPRVFFGGMSTGASAAPSRPSGPTVGPSTPPSPQTTVGVAMIVRERGAVV